MNLLFKNKLYRVLTISRVFNSFGAYLYNIVFVVYAASQYESNLAVYLANIIMVLPSFFSLWIGSKADFTRKKVKWMIATSLAQALLFLDHPSSKSARLFDCLSNKCFVGCNE